MRGTTFKARGRTSRHKLGVMNKTEQKFAEYLDGLRIAGEIHSWRFESVKLRLASKTWYTPDFVVFSKGGLQIFYEVKAYWEDDARVKIKVVAEQYPEYVFRAVKITKDGWSFEDF